MKSTSSTCLKLRTGKVQKPSSTSTRRTTKTTRAACAQAVITGNVRRSGRATRVNVRLGEPKSVSGADLPTSGRQTAARRTAARHTAAWYALDDDIKELMLDRGAGINMLLMDNKAAREYIGVLNAARDLLFLSTGLTNDDDAAHNFLIDDDEEMDAFDDDDESSSEDLEVAHLFVGMVS